MREVKFSVSKVSSCYAEPIEIDCGVIQVKDSIEGLLIAMQELEKIYGGLAHFDEDGISVEII